MPKFTELVNGRAGIRTWPPARPGCRGKSPCSRATSRGLPASPSPSRSRRSAAPLRAPARVSPVPLPHPHRHPRPQGLLGQSCSGPESSRASLPAQPSSRNFIGASLSVSTAARRLPGLAHPSVPPRPPGDGSWISRHIRLGWGETLTQRPPAAWQHPGARRKRGA